MGLISNGTTIFDNGAMASGFGGNMVFISSQTASASASISFTTGIDSTYKEYQFWFINIHPSSATNFQFNGSTDSGSNYNVTKTSSHFNAQHNEADTEALLGYDAGGDLAQSTAFQPLLRGVGIENDQSISGSLTLFNPSSTTYVKHFISVNNCYGTGVASVNTFIAGYFNTTSAINAIRFNMSSGNIDDGTILMFGIK
jgi:hypothetical protein